MDTAAKNQQVKQARKGQHWIDNPRVDSVPKRLFSKADAAVYLGTTVRGITYMIEEGRIPIVRNGRRVLLDVRDLEAYVESNKTYLG